MTSHSPASSPELPKLPDLLLAYYASDHVRAYATAHGLACYEAGRASHAAPTVPVDAVVGEPVADADGDTTSKGQYKRMFTAACEALGQINEALGLDPDDGGAEPILDAIAELKSASLAASMASRAQTEAPKAAPQAVVGEASEDPYFGVQDEVYLTRAVCVMNDVLTDISGWEDQALAEAIKSSKVDLCAMIECIRMRADGSYVPGSKPIDGEFA